MKTKRAENISTAELLDIMQHETDRAVKHYKTDFSEYDAPRIRAEQEKQEKGYKDTTPGFIWITRDSGTWMVSLQKDGSPLDNNFLRAIRDQWSDRREYRITHTRHGWTIEKAGSFGKYSGRRTAK